MKKRHGGDRLTELKFAGRTEAPLDGVILDMYCKLYRQVMFTCH